MNEISSLSGAFEYVNESGIRINGLSNVNGSLSTHYIVYRIDNLINRKYYIGQHKTDDPFDNYMGSGYYLRNAILKDNLSSFIKTILFDVNDFDSMNNKEFELVQLSNCYPFDMLSYNLIPGGRGTREFSESTRERMSAAKRGKPPPNKGIPMSEAQKKKVSKARHEQNMERKRQGQKLPGYHIHTEEQNKRQSIAMKGKMAGEKHPLYGTHRSDATKQKLSKTLKDRGCSKKDKNANYKKSPKDWMSPEKYEKWRANKVGRKQMINGSVIVSVKPDQFQEYLDKGFIFRDKNFKWQPLQKS